ncbi:MAG: hypothetical protein JWM31_722 [Solirubrobacterales bacterium]|nr:hypothetical protein [Solirubrobacterales bacterium]
MSTAEEDERGTPARDTPDNEDFQPAIDESISDQQGETAPPGADENKDGTD